MNKTLLACAALATTLALQSAALAAPETIQASLTLRADQPGPKIDRNIYGHFVEHLGRGVYEGIWVGENSPIPNTRGIRNDVVAALKRINPPVVRWPGGCFADIYHWRDGVGPRDQRPEITNTSWGNAPETNAFGTHEFMDFLEQIGAKAYIGVNMGTASTAEGKAWIDYMTAPAGSSAARERTANGRKEPWAVPYIGVGNESWGCGGTMRADFYADQYRLYQTFLSGYGKKPFFIAAGADTDDYHWTEVLMAKAMNWREKPSPLLYDDPKPLMAGLSLHFYTLTANDWRDKGPAVDFSEAHWISTMKRALTMDEMIVKHGAIMDKYDPQKKVAMIVDEWGTWFNGEKGQSVLYQQSTLRDALVAGVTFNIFHRHADRVRMANIAQLVNVLQSLVLTKGGQMILTPTYHVFDMYKVHQDATALPVDLAGPSYTHQGMSVPALSSSASRAADGTVHLSIVNLDPHRPARISADLKGLQVKTASGQVLTAERMNTHNDFGQPDRFAPQPLKTVRLANGKLEVELPAKSVSVIALR